MIQKGLCDKEFILNPSNFECECYKFYDFSEYLDYKDCKCKKKLVNKLVERSSVEECSENFDETRIVEIKSTECKHNSCTVYTVLVSIFFTINIGIGIYFLCFYWYLKKMLLVLSLVPALRQQFNELINGKSQTNRGQKANLLFLQRHN